MLTPALKFVTALRRAGLRCSPSETISAAKALAAIDLGSKAEVRQALAGCLAKSRREKQIFADCYSKFFAVSPLALDPLPNKGGGKAESFPANGRQPPNLKLDSLQVVRKNIVGTIKALDKIGDDDIVYRTQKPIVRAKVAAALGLPELNQRLDSSIASGSGDSLAATALRAKIERLQDLLEAAIDRHFRLYGEPLTAANRYQSLADYELGRLDPSWHQDVVKAVKRIAAKLAEQRGKVVWQRRGRSLDLAKTCAKAKATFGLPLRLYRRQRKINRQRLVVLADLSPSVQNHARFFFALVHAMEPLISDYRAFVFSSKLGEITSRCKRLDFASSFDFAMRLYGGGSTDYKQALAGLDRALGNFLDSRTSIFVLGDARNNFADPGLRHLAKLKRRAKRLVWLNNEAPSLWGTGDSEMPKYKVFSTSVHYCGTLRQLEKIAGLLAR